jgi:hypothetical protein
MTPQSFPQSNCRFTAPVDLDKSQCAAIDAYSGAVNGGSVDGSRITVVAWRPSPQELAELNAGEPIFVSVMGGLPPHFLTTSFEQAVSPA